MVSSIQRSREENPWGAKEYSGQLTCRLPVKVWKRLWFPQKSLTRMAQAEVDLLESPHQTTSMMHIVAVEDQ